MVDSVHLVQHGNQAEEFLFGMEGLFRNGASPLELTLSIFGERWIISPDFGNNLESTPFAANQKSPANNAFDDGAMVDPLVNPLPERKNYAL